VKIIGRNIVGSLASARRTIALVHCRGRTLALALGCLLHKRYFKGEALLCSWESLLRSGTRRIGISAGSFVNSGRVLPQRLRAASTCPIPPVT